MLAFKFKKFSELIQNHRWSPWRDILIAKHMLVIQWVIVMRPTLHRA